jgi:hypothetical protein
MTEVEENNTNTATNEEKTTPSDVDDPKKKKEVIIRRNRPGTKAEQWGNWPELSFENMNSTCAVQQYIQLLIKRNPEDIKTIVTCPEGQDPNVWQYEHLRLICLELNPLLVMLSNECHPDVCDTMKATDDAEFFCAAHPKAQPCSAIDYSIHTVDGSISLLNCHSFFPTRVSIQPTSLKHFSNIARRLYRIFAHTWFHHREVFVEFEHQSHLYSRFLYFSTKAFNLISPKVVIIPSEDCNINFD